MPSWQEQAQQLPRSEAGLVFFPISSYNHRLVHLFPKLIQAAARRKGRLFTACLAGGYLWIALRGPQGLGALLEKREEIRQLEEQNASLARENERRRDHIRRLEDSQSEQEMEIRKQLKLLRPGETTFILPDTPSGPASPGGQFEPQP
jgi:cell division protein FtsB